MTNYVHWTCINISNKVVHAEMISIDGKDICISQFLNTTMFFL